MGVNGNFCVGMAVISGTARQIPVPWTFFWEIESEILHARQYSSV
jgi:hypothetical protein